MYVSATIDVIDGQITNQITKHFYRNFRFFKMSNLYD